MRMDLAAKPNSRRGLLRAMLSYGIAAGCLWWVFHDLNFRELFDSFRGVNWWWIPAGAIFSVLVYVVAGWEWRILLRPAGDVSLQQTTQAVFAGRFANDVLPVHMGYVVRIFLVSRWSGKNVASIAPSLLVERLFDGFWLALGIGSAAIFFPLPPRIARVAEIWAGIIAFGIVVGAIMVFREPRGSNQSGDGVWRFNWMRKLRDAAAQVHEQIRAIGRSWAVLAAFGLSLLKFAVQCAAFLFVLWAYGFELSLWAQLGAFIVAYVGLSLPSTPASIGVFQLFCIAGLEMFDVPKAAATGFALLGFCVLTIPLSIAGFIAFAQSGLTLEKIRAEAGREKISAECRG